MCVINSPESGSDSFLPLHVFQLILVISTQSSDMVCNVLCALIPILGHHSNLYSNVCH
jgi:hypothetical protein